MKYQGFLRPFRKMSPLFGAGDFFVHTLYKKTALFAETLSFRNGEVVLYLCQLCAWKKRFARIRNDGANEAAVQGSEPTDIKSTAP